MIPPTKSVWLQRAFRVYNRQYLRKSFHCIHFDGDISWLKGDGKTPLLLCANHSSWWDLLLSLQLSDMLPDWDCYGVMDEVQLQRYRFFSRLGVMGVDRTSIRGAREFLKFCQELLQNKPRALFIAPQGNLISNSVRPVNFQPGIGSIAQSLNTFAAATVVFDYEFWSERLPEAFISIRPIEQIQPGVDFSRRKFVRTMECRMEDHLDAFAALRAQRDPSLFRPLLTSSAGISPVYDSMRAISSRLRGEQFVRAHGDIVSPTWNESKPQER